MEAKFNFYDFVGYIIPGAIFVLVLYWFFIGFFGINIKLENIDFFSTIIFLSVSYFFGHLLQGIGSFYTNKNKTTEEGIIRTKKYSCDFLKDDNDFYTPELKKEIKKRIYEVFNIDLEKENVDDKRIKEAFNLCYSLIIQENIAIHTEIFNGFYSFFRGLKITTIFGSVVNLAICIEQLLLSSGKLNFFPVTFRNDYLIVGTILLIIFVISYRISKFRCDDFSKHFANSIYRSFLVYCDKRNLQTEPKLCVPIKVDTIR